MSILTGGLVGKIIDKVWPDKAEAAKAKLRAIELEQNGELKELDAEVQIALGQAAINQLDAKSKSKFQSWWRPAAGWVCVFGLAYSPAVAMLTWLIMVVVWLSGSDLKGFPQPPAIDTGVLVTILIGMLGLGGIRTVERHKRHTEWQK